MRRLKSILCICALSAGLAAPAPFRASAATTAGGGPGDLAGIWFTETPSGFQRDAEKVLKSPFAERFAAVREAARVGQPTGDNTPDCFPPGIPRVLLAPYPIEILETPGQVTIITEYMGQVQRVFMDGRGHPPPDQLDPSYIGHSIGRWEGNTLVVDTVGLRTSTQLDGQLIPHSDELRVEQRYTRRGDKLEIEFTAIDPKAFSTPLKTTKVFDRRNDLNIIEYVCLENNRNPNSANGVTTFLAPNRVGSD